MAELAEAWHDAHLYGAWSALRIAVAVLDAHGCAMTPEEVVAFVDARTQWHWLWVDAPQFGRRGSAVQVDAAGRWVCAPGHPAVQGARRQVRSRLETVRRWAAQRGAPAEWEARRLAAEERRRVHAAELARLRRVLLRAYPPEAPEIVAVLEVSEHRLETLEAGDPRVLARLEAADVVAGLEVRPLLRALGHDSGAQRLYELGPPQKTRRLDRSGRILRITTELLIRGSCGISRPLAVAGPTGASCTSTGRRTACGCRARSPWWPGTGRRPSGSGSACRRTAWPCRHVTRRRTNVNRVRNGSLEWSPYRSPQGRFEGADLRIGHAMEARQSGHPFEVELLRIPPGQRPWPYHWHASQWEFYYVLEGSGEMRLDGGNVPIGAGDAMMCAPREAHQLHNTGQTDLVVQIIADNPSADYCHYPDSGKWAVDGHVLRMAETEYYDGEE
ncbi:MAG: cupin domain-containing protein [Candidatus Latescibacterota bacterium]